MSEYLRLVSSLLNGEIDKNSIGAMLPIPYPYYLRDKNLPKEWKTITLLSYLKNNLNLEILKDSNFFYNIGKEIEKKEISNIIEVNLISKNKLKI